VRAWLVTRMRSRSIDRRSSFARHRRLAEDAARADDQQVLPEPGAPLDGARVRTQLDGLAPELGIVVELAYFDGLSSSEIADRLQIPLGTVKSRMARALGSLRQALQDGGGHT